LSVTDAIANAQVGRKEPDRPLLLILEPEAELHRDLEVLDMVVDDLAADLGNLEPVEMAEGVAGSADGVLDGIVDALLGRPDDLGDAVRAIGHGSAPLG
jgi:hypothetical protein